MNSTTDRIEREVFLNAPRSRVWQALANAEAFGDWFGVAFKGQRFVPGQHTRGQLTYPGYEHLLMEVLVEQLEPERLLSFRWHPYAVDTAIDYSQEPATLVVFELEDVRGGTLLRLTESGFDQLPSERRDIAFRMNSGGWDQQMLNIEKYVVTT